MRLMVCMTLVDLLMRSPVLLRTGWSYIVSILAAYGR